MIEALDTHPSLSLPQPFSLQVADDAAPTNYNATTFAAKGLQSSRLYMYRSSVDPLIDDNAGERGSWGWRLVG